MISLGPIDYGAVQYGTKIHDPEACFLAMTSCGEVRGGLDK